MAAAVVGGVLNDGGWRQPVTLQRLDRPTFPIRRSEPAALYLGRSVGIASHSCPPCVTPGLSRSSRLEKPRGGWWTMAVESLRFFVRMPAAGRGQHHRVDYPARACASSPQSSSHVVAAVDLPLPLSPASSPDLVPVDEPRNDGNEIINALVHWNQSRTSEMSSSFCVWTSRSLGVARRTH